jgi:hypothetical protein
MLCLIVDHCHRVEKPICSSNIYIYIIVPNFIYKCTLYICTCKYNTGTFDNTVACMQRLYKTGIGLTTGFIGSHTITVYTLYNSLLQLRLFWHPLPSLTNSLQPDCSLNSQSQSHITTDDQLVSASWFRAPSGAHDQMLITV